MCIVLVKKNEQGELFCSIKHNFGNFFFFWCEFYSVTAINKNILVIVGQINLNGQFELC